MWKPIINRHTPHKIKAIINALKKDICSGQLASGERLPTQTELADCLGIAKSTVARAYQEANSAGLIKTIVGNGSFVSGKSDQFLSAVGDGNLGLLDLRVDYPLYEFDPSLSEILSQIAMEDSQHLLTYQDHAGREEFRNAGLTWLQLNGVDCSVDDVVITSGAQHAITVCLSSIAKAGQTVLVEELTYPGIKESAEMLGINLISLSMDENGIIPQALLDAFYNNENVKALYTSPTVQNPTTILTPTERRVEIANICQKHGIYILEDDIHRLFADVRPEPYANLLPELTFFIASFSKVVCGGLRIAYVRVPSAVLKIVRRRLLATHWTLPPLMAEIATRWINNGTASSTLLTKKEEAVRRQKLAKKIIGQKLILGNLSSFYVWIKLPAEWSTEVFISEAFENNIAVLGNGTFSVSSNSNKPGVRLCLGAVPNIAALEVGLLKLAEMLKDGPSAAMGVI
jgi:DNA-binding transcriptional MocR family regulator